MTKTELLDYIFKKRQQIVTRENSLRTQISVVKQNLEDRPQDPNVALWKPEMAKLLLDYVEIPERETNELCDLITEELKLPKNEALKRNSNAAYELSRQWAEKMING